MTICARECTADADCEGTVCRLLDGDGLLTAVALEDVDAEVSGEDANVDDAPECEGSCAAYSGDLTISQPSLVALCDPYFAAAAPIEMDSSGDIWISEPAAGDNQ